MGKVLKIIVGLVLVAVLGFAGLLYWAHDAGESAQEDFFKAVLSGEPAQVQALFHPDMATQVDEPVLAAWMQAVELHLGAFKGMSGSHFNTSVNYKNGKKVVESKGTVKFERGDATSNLKYIDDKIVAWEVQSDAMPANWFTKLDEVSLYDTSARTLLTALMKGEEEAALALMHENLRKKFAPGSLAQSLAGVVERHGELEGIEALPTEFVAGPPAELLLRYTLRGSKGSLPALVRFRIEGMRMHLLGLAVPDRD